MSILDKEQRNIVTINKKDDLKTRLKCFAIKHLVDKSRDPLTNDEKDALKSLKNNKEIVIQRPDKGGGVVIMNDNKYRTLLNNIVNDPTKFEKCNKNQTEKLKKEINVSASKLWQFKNS